MFCNVGRLDRIARIVVGLLIMGAGLVNESWWGVAGILPIITAVIGWCPLYSLFGFRTSRKGEKASTLPDTSSEEIDRKSLK